MSSWRMSRYTLLPVLGRGHVDVDVPSWQRYRAAKTMGADTGVCVPVSAPGSNPGCRCVQTLTSVEDIKRYFALVEKEENRIEEELRVKRQACARIKVLDDDVVRVVADLEAFAPRVRTAASSTVTEAEAVIAKTRMLDAAHSRVQQVRCFLGDSRCASADPSTVTVTTWLRAVQALERVEDILDLKSCLSGVQVALHVRSPCRTGVGGWRCRGCRRSLVCRLRVPIRQGGNLQQAAMHVKRFRGVEALVPVLTEDREYMRAAEQELSSLVESQFASAIAQNDMEGVTTCCQLMNLLGQSNKVRSRTRSRSRWYWQLLSRAADPGVTAGAGAFAFAPVCGVAGSGSLRQLLGVQATSGAGVRASACTAVWRRLRAGIHWFVFEFVCLLG